MGNFLNFFIIIIITELRLQAFPLGSGRLKEWGRKGVLSLEVIVKKTSSGSKLGPPASL